MGKKKLVAALGAAALAASMAVVFSSSPAQAAVFTPSTPGPFSIPDNSSIDGNVTLNNAAGLVTDVNVKFNDLGSTFGDDLDIELVGPTGVAVMLMSDTCGDVDFEDIDLTFDDEASTSLQDSSVPVCAGGTFKPTNFGAGDPMPTATPSASLSVFDGTNPNGTWQLRMVDDTVADVSDMEGGYQLTIVTAPFSILIPGTGTSGPASPYPFAIPVSGKVGKVADLNVVLSGVTQQFMEDLDILLVAPNGAKALILSDRCVSAFVTNNTYTLDDEAATAFPTGATCPSGTYQPADTGAGDTFAAPAPAGPYTPALSAFDGLDPNGTWNLFITDDLGGGNGFFINDPTLVFTMTDIAAPETLLGKKKPHTGFQTSATVSFTSSEAGSHFECKIDGGKFKACSSPTKLKHLKIGKHKFFVRAIDAAGNVDPSPAKVKWRVVKRP
jgi:subtilisin-like proprotein convertase family protein